MPVATNALDAHFDTDALTGMTPLFAPTARVVARTLLTREVAGLEEPAMIATALQNLCTRILDNLRRSVGDDGRNALLARALTRTHAEHPVLAEIRRVSDADIFLDGIAASVGVHGLPVVVAAVEAVIAALIDVLTGLIGADMVLNLLLDDGASGCVSTTRRTP